MKLWHIIVISCLVWGGLLWFLIRLGKRMKNELEEESKPYDPVDEYECKHELTEEEKHTIRQLHHHL